MTEFIKILTDYEAALQEDINEGGDEAADALDKARQALLAALKPQKEIEELRAALVAAEERVKELDHRLQMQCAVSDCLGRAVSDKDADRIFFRDKLKEAEQRAERAAADEREACAKVCDDIITKRKEQHLFNGFNAIRQCVEAIRARAG